ncbi:hypothetical protein FGO68_gene14394 [Halteria grandinella]|uniref:Uncharacterized protein n=1 Tax=Halteria grandinella TaxID=5974 RepID=A0A8J8T096_HALGN|nr:hypothetical protein FGO68_gene14394 [Halteria grandinella]
MLEQSRPQIQSCLHFGISNSDFKTNKLKQKISLRESTGSQVSITIAEIYLIWVLSMKMMMISQESRTELGFIPIYKEARLLYSQMTHTSTELKSYLSQCFQQLKNLSIKFISLSQLRKLKKSDRGSQKSEKQTIQLLKTGQLECFNQLIKPLLAV